MSTRLPAAAQVSTDVVEIERALTRITYLTSRVKQHERLVAVAAEPLRLGELAARLAVEASHVTRQVQQLQKAGYVTRVPDPDDRRAQRIQLTPFGKEAYDRIREASWRGMQMALAEWSPQDLRQLASLFHRMVDDFLGFATDDDGAEQAEQPEQAEQAEQHGPEGAEAAPSA
jgi:DNA-binding MarR family transcriptional regulator